MSKHYLHISYTAQINGTPRILCAECLFWVDTQDLTQIRNALKSVCEKQFNIKLDHVPTITSLSEISEELYHILLGNGKDPLKNSITNQEFDDKQQKYFDEMNSVGLGELILFGRSLDAFVEKESQRSNLLKAITGLCGYEVNAREFAKNVSYDDFKKIRGITETTALGFRLFLLYQCGVDWMRPNVKVVVFGEQKEK